MAHSTAKDLLKETAERLPETAAGDEVSLCVALTVRPSLTLRQPI